MRVQICPCRHERINDCFPNLFSYADQEHQNAAENRANESPQPVEDAHDGIPDPLPVSANQCKDQLNHSAQHLHASLECEQQHTKDHADDLKDLIAILIPIIDNLLQHWLNEGDDDRKHCPKNRNNVVEDVLNRRRHLWKVSLHRLDQRLNADRNSADGESNSCTNRNHLCNRCDQRDERCDQCPAHDYSQRA